MRCWIIGILGLALVATLGCGSGNRVDVTVTPPPPPAAKLLLQEVAATGQLGSGAEAIREGLEMLKQSDPHKAELLLREFDQLSKAAHPHSVSAKAKALAAKL